jgi:hypothetical protein
MYKKLWELFNIKTGLIKKIKAKTKLKVNVSNEK